jgi:uncharacterized protein (TIGR02270 family)
MATSPRSFLIELYEEYLEEASFLYEQRKTLFVNPEITWRKIGEFEERLEAHIDGLVVGDKLALEVCKRHAAQGDFGELFAATSVFCRQDQRDFVLAAFDQLDPEDAPKAGAMADALKYELPDAWIRDFLTLLESGQPKLAPILARAFGYCRIEAGPQLLKAMKRCTPSALPELVWALGRSGYEQAKAPLFDYLQSEDEPVRSAAALALMRLGEPRAIQYCLGKAQSSIWPILPLGMAGGRDTLAMLTELAKKSNGAECLIALGLLGDPANVALLIARLEQPESAASAAMALQCLTGAERHETVFIPDEIDEDELLESEREAVKQGKQPTRGDGRPFGSTVTRLSQEPAAWNQWWRENGDRFSPGIRYRGGGPVSPARLVGMLQAVGTPYPLRKCCSEELVTRYGHDFGLEVDAPVVKQLGRLAEAEAWTGSNSGRFREGAWYFAGYARD